jgi:hypothetical protein
MMNNRTIIDEARTRAAGMEFSHRWLILEMAKRLELFTDAGVVPVVRCKDCKHYGTYECALDTYLYETTEEAFCSYGERGG